MKLDWAWFAWLVDWSEQQLVIQFVRCNWQQSIKMRNTLTRPGKGLPAAPGYKPFSELLQSKHVKLGNRLC